MLSKALSKPVPKVKRWASRLVKKTLFHFGSLLVPEGYALPEKYSRAKPAAPPTIWTAGVFAKRAIPNPSGAKTSYPIPYMLNRASHNAM